MLSGNDDLRQQPLEGGIYLVAGKPVVKQDGLRADLPGGEQVGDERERRCQAQCDGPAAAQPGVGQDAVPLRHQPAERGAADGLGQVQADIRGGTRQQYLVNPRRI